MAGNLKKRNNMITATVIPLLLQRLIYIMSFAIFSVRPIQCMVCGGKVAQLSGSDLLQFTECKLPASHTDRKQDNVLTYSIRDLTDFNLTEHLRKKLFLYGVLYYYHK